MTVSDGCYGGNKINNAEQGSESWGNEGKVHIFQFLSGYWASLLAQQLRICLPGGGLGSIPGSGRSSGEENNSPLQYSCLGNPTDRGTRWAIVHGVAKDSQNLMTKQQNKAVNDGLIDMLLFAVVLKEGEGVTYWISGKRAFSSGAGCSQFNGFKMEVCLKEGGQVSRR